MQIQQVFWFSTSQAKPTSPTLGKYNNTVGYTAFSER
jgi:hypothetical protein